MQAGPLGWILGLNPDQGSGEQEPQGPHQQPQGALEGLGGAGGPAHNGEGDQRPGGDESRSFLVPKEIHNGEQAGEGRIERALAPDRQQQPETGQPSPQGTRGLVSFPRDQTVSGQDQRGNPHIERGPQGELRPEQSPQLPQLESPGPLGERPVHPFGPRDQLRCRQERRGGPPGAQGQDGEELPELGPPGGGGGQNPGDGEGQGDDIYVESGLRVTAQERHRPGEDGQHPPSARMSGFREQAGQGPEEPGQPGRAGDDRGILKGVERLGLDVRCERMAPQRVGVPERQLTGLEAPVSIRGERVMMLREVPGAEGGLHPGIGGPERSV
ncbi:hypothetical protein HRbin22_00823 [Candidatus Thermoflexus japonica]|uniref:Uncharacterized protein n=1 Tax=Candidatus Thermoflexus japonica TaxID=2035417 RepID=A0A2H5Y5B8_9CHLR|nr:hypothetical protein HRbin22_00823 [Candidatus Thermoflexus japonica]